MSSNFEPTRPLMTTQPLSHARAIANPPQTRQQPARQPTQDYPMSPMSDYRSFPQSATGDPTSSSFGTAEASMDNPFWLAPAQRMDMNNMSMYPSTPAMTYASVSVDSQVWESKQPGKRSKRGAVAELSKEEGREKRRLQNRISQRTLRTRRLEERNALMSSVHELSDQNQKLQEQLKQVVFQLNFWHNRELTKCNEKRAKIGSPPYESFDAMVRSDGETDRQIFSVPYVQVQNAFTMQVLDTERRSSEAHSGSGASDELLDDDSDDEGGDGNYSPITHRKRSYRHSTIKSKSSDSSLLLYPSTGQTNKRVSFSSSASSSRPSSSGSSANSAVSRARKPSTRGHVSSPPDLDPVTEESPYTITQPEKNLYHRYSQMTVASDDSYFALDAPSSSGYA